MSDEEAKADSGAEGVTGKATDATPAENKSAENGPAESKAAETESAEAETAESKGETTQVIEQRQPAPPQRKPRTPGEGMRLVRKGLGWLASLVKVIGLLAALVLIVHIIFVVAHANPAHPLTVFIGGWAQKLTLGLSNLFQLGDPTLAVLVNYGLPAIAWLIATSIIASVLRKI